MVSVGVASAFFFFPFEYAAGLMTSTVITRPAATTAALRSQEFPVFIYPLSAPMSLRRN